MSGSRLLAIATACTAAITSSARANDTEIVTTPLQEPAVEQNAPASTAELDSDNAADLLNSRQQLQQSFTFTRTINGEVVETEKRTVTYTADDPYYETEAGQSTKQKLQDAFDKEVLTRTEAFEEAKLDFTIADVNRDGSMTAEEFVKLNETWQDGQMRVTDAPTDEIARQRQYDAFLDEIDASGAKERAAAAAKQKFNFLSGASEAMTREDYIREYLLDFDSMDENRDTLLRGAELMMFRALNRGETLER
ncbi:MAG: hypothetical protein AAGC77_08575 [Pseudomonadota bacterium]